MSEAKEVLEFIEQECDSLRKLKKQLTESEAEKLIALYGKEAVVKQLAKMDNWRDIGKNKSVYLTCEKWFDTDVRKGYIRPPEKKQSIRGGNVLKDRFLERYAIGSRIQSNTGRIFKVINESFIEQEGTRDVMPINQIATREFTVLPQLQEISA